MQARYQATCYILIWEMNIRDSFFCFYFNKINKRNFVLKRESQGRHNGDDGKRPASDHIKDIAISPQIVP